MSAEEFRATLISHGWYVLQPFQVSLDIFWLKDESREDSENVPAPEELARDIVENLQEALQQFGGIAEELGER